MIKNKNNKNVHIYDKELYLKAIELYELGLKEFYGYTPTEIINMANSLYEDTIENDTEVEKITFNKIISRINYDLGLKLPSIINDSGMETKYPNYRFNLPYMKAISYNGTEYTMGDEDVTATFQTYIKFLNVNISRLEDENGDPLSGSGRLRFVIEGGNLIKDTDDTRPATFFVDLRIGLNSNGTLTTYGNALLDESFVNLGSIQVIDNVDIVGISFGYGTGDDDTEDGVGGLNFYIRIPQVIGGYAYPLTIKEVNITTDNLKYTFGDFEILTNNDGTNTNFIITDFPILSMVWNVPIEMINNLLIPAIHSVINIKEGDYDVQTSPELQYLRGHSDFMLRTHDLIPNIYIDKTTLDKIYKTDRDKSKISPRRIIRW